VYGAFIHLGKGIAALRCTSAKSATIASSQSKISLAGVMVLSLDIDLRCAVLNQGAGPTPGDMLRNRQLVFDKAEEMAAAL
jgi:small subunit ribosomal protein S1